MEKVSSKKIFFTFFLFMFVWSFYQTLQNRKYYGSRQFYSPFGGTVSEDELIKYRGAINVNLSNFNKESIDQMCLNKYVEYYPIIKECKQLGFVVSDDQIKDSIITKTIFFEDGAFSESLFKDYLLNCEITESDYYDLIKEELMIKQYFYFIKNSYSIPNKVKERFKKQYTKTLSIKYGFIDHKTVQDRIAYKFDCSESVLKDFYEQNKSKFDIQIEAEYKIYSLKNIQKNHSLFTFYLNNKMKDEILKVFEGNLLNLLDKKNQNILDYIQSRLKHCFKDNEFETFRGKEDEVYLLIIEKSRRFIERKYEDISREDLLYEYLIAQAKEAVNESFITNWKTQQITVESLHIPNIPFKFIEYMFTAKIKDCKRFQDDKKTYYLIVENVAFSNEKISDDVLKMKMDEILIDAVKQYLDLKAKQERK